MKQMSCEHENAVVRALHSDEWAEELRLHLSDCQDCREALQLAEALGEVARHAEIHCNPPDAHWILQRSRLRSREIAMRRVAWLLTAMRTLAAVYVGVAAVWLLRGYVTLEYRGVASALHGTASGFAQMGAMVAAVCVVVGLFPILRESAVSAGLYSTKGKNR
jgi:predicted anti-sigma-YlaC factor YlaD